MTKDKEQKDEQKDGQEPGQSTEFEELKAKCEEYLNGWKRAKADYENLKKETEKKTQELAEYIQAGTILELLPIYDHYKLALSHLPKEQEATDWAQGLIHIKNDFIEFFKQFEIEEIKTVGEQFNPLWHEAISYEESVAPDGQIIREVAAGYKIKDNVIRVAKVIVAKNCQTSTESQTSTEGQNNQDNYEVQLR